MKPKKRRTVYLLHSWPPTTRRYRKPIEKEKQNAVLGYLQLPLTAAIVTGLLGLFASHISHQYQSRLQTVEILAERERTEAELASAEKRAQAEIEATQIRTLTELVLKEGDLETADDYALYIGTLTSFGKYSIPTLLGFMGKTREDGNESAVDEALERALLSLAQVFGHPREVADAMGAVLGTRTDAFNYRAHLTAIKVLANVEGLDQGAIRSLLQRYQPEKNVEDFGKMVAGDDRNTINFCCPLQRLRERFKVDFLQDECDGSLKSLKVQKGIPCP